MNDADDVLQVIQAVFVGLLVTKFLVNTGRALKAIELCKECLIFLRNEVPGKKEHFAKLSMEEKFAITLAKIYERQNKYAEARELYERAINITKHTRNKKGEAHAYGQFGTMSSHLGEYVKAREYLEKALAIKIDIGDRKGEATLYGNLGIVLQNVGRYDKAKEYYEQALAITIEIGDKAGEAAVYGNLGTLSQNLGEFHKAREYHKKALAIKFAICDRRGEATCYGNLGIVFHSLGEYDKAVKYLEKALAIKIEVEDRAGEANCYGNLGTVFQSLGEYDKAREYLEKALAIRIEIGDRKEEATDYGNLGTLFQSLAEYDKAVKFLEKALAIRIEIGDKKGEANSYGNLGTVSQYLGEYDKAREYHEKALAIRIEIGDKKGQATDYGNLATVFQSLGEYDKAVKYLEKALAMRIEVEDRAGEANCYGNLGTVFQSLGEYDKAREYLEKALAIRIQIGDKKGEATNYGKLATVFQSRGEYDKAVENLENALTIIIKIGDRAGEASCYGNLGTVFQSLGEHDRARVYHEKALAIRIKIGDRRGEAADYGNLGTVFQSLGKHVMAETYLEKALSISKDIGDHQAEFTLLYSLTTSKLFQEKMKEAFDCLLQCINKSENLRSFLKDNDQFKISFSDVHDFPYRELSAFFCFNWNPNNGLYVLELSRARTLADLMANQYSAEMQISANSQSWIGIENIMRQESNCACLYISYYAQELFLWIIKTSGVIYFRTLTINENLAPGGLIGSFDDLFATCFPSPAAWRIVEDDDEASQNPEWSLSLSYRMLIAPVADLLEEPEIIIVPDRSLNQIPFAALTDEGGKYLSETFRIRIVPSLSTLKLIQDSPSDYHNQIGALIIGDPEVGRVRFKGRRKTFLPLPCAKKEAEMIGELLGVQPLLGECATKQAVLERLNSVSLIHFAAHGNAERGEIALSPVHSTNRIPLEEDYLLTMSDISKVRLRAKLVVLSCCHSGRGQIRAEGVVGIARAFLGSGARSVLVALWALNDRATKQFMRRFYEHLVRGESASEALHETMKWMRGNGFTKVSEWAPFMLIGDNVAFDFVK